MVDEDLLEVLCLAAREGRIQPTRHYELRMLRGDRPSEADVAACLCDPEAIVIERYEDPRGRSVLVYGRVNGRPAHVLVTYPPWPLITTAYWPDTEPMSWTNDFRKRL